MYELHDLKDDDLQGLMPEVVTALAQQMLRRMRQQENELEQRASEIKLKDAKIEKITFELAQLKAWKFGAKTEAMSAEQRRLFDETLAEDEASLQAQLQQAKGTAPEGDGSAKRKPRRQALPDHLRRVKHHHEPEDTTCPSADCGRAMVRVGVGEDVSEKLDIVPAQFFVHRHIYGKWACRCCQLLKQEPAAPQIIDGGMPAAGLEALLG
jgi:transposase